MRFFFIVIIMFIVLSGCAARQSPEYYVRIAGQYYRQGEYQKAAEECQKALLGYPFLKEAQYNLGNAYVKMEQWDNALHAFQQAVWIQDTYPQPHYGLAVVYARTGDLKKAYEELQKYLTLVPGDKNARKLLRQVKEEMKQ